MLRRTLTALESRQRQQERLHAWQLSVADEAARVHFQLLTGELRALELHERVRTAIEQADAHAALVQELSTARAQLSDALDRAEHAEAEAVCALTAVREQRVAASRLSTTPARSSVARTPSFRHGKRRLTPMSGRRDDLRRSCCGPNMRG